MIKEGVRFLKSVFVLSFNLPLVDRLSRDDGEIIQLLHHMVHIFFS